MPVVTWPRWCGRRHRRGRRGRSRSAARRRPGGLRSRPSAFGAPRRHRGAEAGGAFPARAGDGCHRRGRSAGRERRGPADLWPRCFRRGDGRASRASRARAACPRVPGWSPAGGPPRALCRHRRRRHRHGFNGPCRLSGGPRPWGGSGRDRRAGRLALCGDRHSATYATRCCASKFQSPSMRWGSGTGTSRRRRTIRSSSFSASPRPGMAAGAGATRVTTVSSVTRTSTSPPAT